MIDLTDHATRADETGWVAILRDEVRSLRALVERLGGRELAVLRDAAAREELAGSVSGPVGGDAPMPRASVAALMRRAYDAEAARLAGALRGDDLDAATRQLTWARDAISRLGEPVHLAIADEYHERHVAQLRVVAERRTGARLARDAVARRAAVISTLDELQAVKSARLEEWARYERVRVGNDPAAAAAATTRMATITETIRGIDERTAAIRAQLSGGDVDTVELTLRDTPIEDARVHLRLQHAAGHAVVPYPRHAAARRRRRWLGLRRRPSR